MGEHTQVEYLLLADSVQVVDGRLSMVGGGWDTLFFPDVPRTVSLAIACGVRVPWPELDREHTLIVSVAGTDGRDLAPPHRQSFRVGQPPTLSRGASAHVPFAITWELTFPRYGGYAVTARLEGPRRDERTVGFTIRPAADTEPAISEEEENFFDEEMELTS